MNGVLHVKQESWNSGAGRWLEAATDESYPLNNMREDCLSGHCALFNVYDDAADHIASFVLRIDGGPVREMVVVAAGGHLVNGSLYKIITPYVEEQARRHDCEYLRGHCQREGVGRLMQRAGWEQSEIVYRKKVQHGRVQ